MWSDLAYLDELLLDGSKQPVGEFPCWILTEI